MSDSVDVAVLLGACCTSDPDVAVFELGAGCTSDPVGDDLRLCFGCIHKISGTIANVGNRTI